MSERADFLCEYASRWLGRDLTKEEAELVSAETSRRAVQDLCAEFSAKGKGSAKAKPKKTKSVSVEEVVEEIVNEEQSQRGKGSE